MQFLSYQKSLANSQVGTVIVTLFHNITVKFLLLVKKKEPINYNWVEIPFIHSFIFILPPQIQQQYHKQICNTLKIIYTTLTKIIYNINCLKRQWQGSLYKLLHLRSAMIIHNYTELSFAKKAGSNLVKVTHLQTVSNAPFTVLINFHFPTFHPKLCQNRDVLHQRLWSH